MSKQADKLEMFSEARIALMREVNKHPELVEKVYAVTAAGADWPEQLAEIAAHCMVILDGFYTQDQLEVLAEQLFFKLRDSRSIIVLPRSISSNTVITDPTH